MNKTLRNILIAAAAVVALVLLLPFLVPMDAYRGRIETAAGGAVGRTFRIEGPLRLMIFPHLGLRANEVTLANVPGGRAAALVTVGDIELAVRILPLLTGRIALDQIVLNQPTIALEVDAEGRGNWQFARTAKKRPNGSAVALPSGTEFAGIKIDDGRITYDNARTHTHRAVEHVNAEVAITRLDEPVSVTGNLTIGPRKVDFDARMETLKTFLGAGTTNVRMSAKAELMTASFQGHLEQDGETNGIFRLDTPSFRDLAGWLGEPLPGGGLNELSLQGHVQSKDKVTRLDSLRLTLDRQKMNGWLTIDSRPKVPVLEGDLTADHLDLNPYLTSHTAAPAAASKPEPGWSRTPVSTGLIKEFDGKLRFSTGALRIRGLHLGPTTLKIDNQGGVLTATLDPISLYGGSGQAVLLIDVRGPVPSLHNTLNFHNVALNPFLRDTLSVDSLEGTGALTLDVTSRGRSAAEIMHALAGRGAITGANGRFRGIDMGQVARTVQTFLGGADKLARTDFHAMGGTFVIAQGVLTNSDFHLDGPVVLMRGSGRLDLGNRTIDFRLEPSTAMAGLNIGIPFRIKGSWDHVHYAPDYADMLGGAVDNLKNGRAPLKGLFGGGPHKKKSLGDTLKDVFGIH